MQMSIPFKPVVDNNVLCFTPIFQNQTDIIGFFLISSNIFVKSYFTKKSILFILAGKKSLLTLVNK